MWVTQTYLGKVEPDAKIFVYYLFEDYNSTQGEFTERVQSRLEEMGITYESNVSLLMPNPRYAARIEAEVRGIEKLWRSLQGKLPGVFVSTSPLSAFDIEKGNYYFASFHDTDPTSAAEVIRELQRLIDNQLAHDFKSAKPEQKNKLLQRLYNAIEAKPGVFGFAIDLKKLTKKH